MKINTITLSGKSTCLYPQGKEVREWTRVPVLTEEEQCLRSLCSFQSFNDQNQNSLC